MSDADYLDGGTDSELAHDIYALQHMAYLDGVRHVLGVMEKSLEEKRMRYDDPTALTAEKLKLGYEIDLLRKMIHWTKEQAEL